MFRLHRLAPALLVTAAISPIAGAQPPPTAGARVAPTATSPPQVVPGRTDSRSVPVARTQAAPRRRSIVHHYPYPYPGYYNEDQTAGWRNPGGVGRYREYYPPGAQYEMNVAARDPVRVATFGDGGIPSRQEQLAAQQIGIARENAIQSHIDSYARPYYGYGLGVGYFGGFN